MRARRLLALCSAAFAAVLLTPVTAGAETAAPLERYVALGDSYASLGSLTKTVIDPETGCLRSRDNYPALVADGLEGAEFVDATCAGAVTGGVLDPQLESVTPDTDLVTLTVGGNDVGFADIALTCALRSVPDPEGTPCEDHYTEGGTDRLAQRIADTAPKIDEVLAGVAERAPDARVVVTGYLRILPPDTGCWPAVPISAGDVAYINGVQDKLNAMVGDRAAAAGFDFVDPGTTRGHDACQAPSNRWVDGLLPLSNGAPLHPTAAGQRHVTELVNARL
ncbi:SGNH/GDSL hydrolase family protein [Streptomyces xiaopingdaonensis]|uniref:SGNH/GDSL hydrolase family protein n=1 Tax=Streptomyces xiaopingdaonensis TaxID=1565415 RepID=UPI000494615C|nr:SGNH/GDSL hydrolase family protein [Streptomyces xiaopingdaonensis]